MDGILLGILVVRNNAISNIQNPSSTGFTLRAVMYQYTDTLGIMCNLIMVIVMIHLLNFMKDQEQFLKLVMDMIHLHF